MSFFTVVYHIEPLFTADYLAEIGIHQIIYVYFALKAYFELIWSIG